MCVNIICVPPILPNGRKWNSTGEQQEGTECQVLKHAVTSSRFTVSPMHSNMIVLTSCSPNALQQGYSPRTLTCSQFLQGDIHICQDICPDHHLYAICCVEIHGLTYYKGIYSNSFGVLWNNFSPPGGQQIFHKNIRSHQVWL